jgi:predicted dehydrogenase
MPTRSSRRIRYAVVGAGHIAQAAVLPAFRHARNSTLVALVSGDAVKRRTLSRRHAIATACGYDGYDELLRSGAVDAVYIARPNPLHRDFTVRAARAGVHVLCEKPMAVTARDCQAMIAACARAGVRLMIAYRLHFEAANLRAIEIARSGALGELRLFDSVFAMQVRAGNIRVRRAMGGGTLYDIGVYCINAARALFGDEPVEATAVSVRGASPRFREVDEATACVLRFPGDRLATFTCSFGAAHVSAYRLVGTLGDLQLDPAYGYKGALKQTLTIGGKPSVRTFAPRDQFAPEIVTFSEAILRGRDPEPSGAEGLADVRIVEALYRSARSGRPVRLTPVAKTRRPGTRQEKRRPPVREPRIVHAKSPSRG